LAVSSWGFVRSVPIHALANIVAPITAVATFVLVGLYETVATEFTLTLLFGAFGVHLKLHPTFLLSGSFFPRLPFRNFTGFHFWGGFNWLALVNGAFVRLFKAFSCAG